MGKILLVEDDREISDMVTDYLLGENFEVDCIDDGQKVMKLFDSKKYDLILLDLMLPHCSGIEIIKEVRKVSTIPIIIVTAKTQDTDKTMGLNLGADDYVTKPFSLIELTARIKANIRRVTSYSMDVEEENQLIRVKDLTIDVKKHCVSVGEKLLDLTYTEFEIIRLLAAHPGQAFSKEKLYDLIWKEPYYGNENVLNTHINRLRGKLKRATPEGKEYIKTLWGIGYKMEE